MLEDQPVSENSTAKPTQEPVSYVAWTQKQNTQQQNQHKTVT